MSKFWLKFNLVIPEECCLSVILGLGSYLDFHPESSSPGS